jgi:hypothetical protein
MAMIAAAPTSYHRLASTNISRLSDWEEAVKKEYPLKKPRPQLTLVDLKVPASDEDDNDTSVTPRLTSHRAMRIRSVIDIHAWDQAGWKGACYLNYGPGRPPGLAFMFENADAARKIFQRWRERFGNRDTDEEIYIAVVRHLPAQDPHHYLMVVSSKLPDALPRDPKRAILTVSQSITMTPDSDQNLKLFLDAYQEVGEFYLLPAVLVNSVPELMPELTILKRNISIKDAASIGERDIEAMELRRRSKPT